MYTLTDYVSTHATDEVDEPHPQPANGALNLPTYVQLDGNHNDDVNHTQMDEDGEKPPPKLVGCWQVGSVVVNAHRGFVKSTYTLETVDFQAAVFGEMELASTSLTLLKAGDFTQPSNRHTAGVERG